MFCELAPLLSKRAFVLFLTGLPDGKIQVNFVPTATDKDTSTDTPLLKALTFTGTPADLDTDLSEAITSYVETHLTILESVEATKAAMKAAHEAETLAAKAKADAAKAKAKPGHTPKPLIPAAPSLFGPATVEPVAPVQIEPSSLPATSDWQPNGTVSDEDFVEDEDE